MKNLKFWSAYIQKLTQIMTWIRLFPKLVVLELTKDGPITKLSPFITEKILSSMNKPKSIKKLANTLLVEATKKTNSNLLLEQKYFYNLWIKTCPLNSLKLSKSVMRSSDLPLCTLDEIPINFCKQGITDTQRISKKQNDKIIQTNKYILSFNTLKTSTKIE